MPPRVSQQGLLSNSKKVHLVGQVILAVAGAVCKPQHFTKLVISLDVGLKHCAQLHMQGPTTPDSKTHSSVVDQQIQRKTF